MPRRRLMGYYLEHKHRLAALIVAAAVLAAGASLALAWVAGFGRIVDRLHYPHWPWLAAALGGEIVAYLGYILAYREVARAEGAPRCACRGWRPSSPRVSASSSPPVASASIPRLSNVRG